MRHPWLRGLRNGAVQLAAVRLEMPNDLQALIQKLQELSLRDPSKTARLLEHWLKQPAGAGKSSTARSSSADPKKATPKAAFDRKRFGRGSR